MLDKLITPLEKSRMKLAFTDEVRTSIILIKNGLKELQSISGSNDFYHAPILLLSNGFERLIKCSLCLTVFNDKWEVIEIPYNIREEGHDLKKLLDILLKKLDEDSYSSKAPAIKEDMHFLKNNITLRDIIKLFSEFADKGRYYNLDIIFAQYRKKVPQTKKNNYPEPYDFENAWQQIENRISNELQLNSYELDIDDIMKKINKEIIKILERFARALVRVFTLSDYRDKGKIVSPLIGDFLFLRDNQLGETVY